MKIITQKVQEAREIYDYMPKMTFPYNYVTDYKTWGKSYLYDIDGDGRTLFSELETMGHIRTGSRSDLFNLERPHSVLIVTERYLTLFPIR